MNQNITGMSGCVYTKQIVVGWFQVKFNLNSTIWIGLIDYIIPNSILETEKLNQAVVILVKVGDNYTYYFKMEFLWQVLGHIDLSLKKKI